MERINYILEDSHLRDIADGTPYSEGRLLSDFMDELAEARKACTEADVALCSGPARLLFLVRSVYLLGVLRGGEGYRAELLAAEYVSNPGMGQQTFAPVPFELSESCAQMFVDDLNELTGEEMAKLWASLNF